MGILFGDRERRTQTFPEPPIPPFPGANVFGQTASVNTDQALAVPTVWACIGLLANAVSMMPLQTYRRTDGIPARITDPPVVTSPSSGLTQSEWLHQLMVSLLLRGNAYARISSRDGQGRATQLDLIHPDTVAVTVNSDGSLTYRVRGQQVPTYDIWHARGMTMPGSKVGMAPISYAAAQLGLDLSSRSFASDYFAGGGIPKAVLKTDQRVDQEQARTVKERLMSSIRSREPIVLGAGLDYQQIQVKPEESQFLLTQQASVSQIAKFFWVPPEMVGGTSGNSMTYANVEQRSLDFLTYSLSPWLKRIEDAIFPLLPQPQFVNFDTSALLRTDAETAAKVDVILIAGKIKAPSEIRNERNMPPMTEDQQREVDMVPLAPTPMGGAKALPALKEPPGPAAPVPADDSSQEQQLSLHLVSEHRTEPARA